jgi:5-methylcytosine-specific restriction endonuclease McrBC regulatory subunit McrC
MRRLVPDGGLRGSGRLIWVDAKYKAHLQLLAQRGWSGLDDSTRAAHRADLHQALAYAALEQEDRVDSVLVYPQAATDVRCRPAVATIGVGHRRVRLLLVGLSFGFHSPDQREAALAEWREFLAA